jgi:hypothetical protein
LLTDPKRSATREARILDEIIVDANGSEEQALGWYYYLQNQLRFPFTARCTAQRPTSPLKKSEEVTVLAMAPEEECEREMFVRVRWQRRSLCVPLAQLRPTRVAQETRQAVEDWRHWVAQGYEF